MSQPVALGIDVGGTHLRAGAVTASGRLLDRVRTETPAQAPDTLVEGLVEVIDSFPSRLPVGVGIAGLVARDGTVAYGPNIGIRDFPLAARLAARVGPRVVALNDGSAATFAEQRVGAGRRHRDVVLLTMGTGVGGGVVVDGRLVLGRSGYAGELGHVILERDGRLCPCGNRGCLEAYASGTAVAALASEGLATDGHGSRLAASTRLDGHAVSRAAAAGDRFAQDVLATVGGWLGVAVASLVNILDPEIVLLGGGAAETTAEWVLPAARRGMAERILGSGLRSPPAIELAALGDDAGTVGAGLFAAERHVEQGLR